MKYIKFGIVSFAFGLVLLGAGSASAQNRRYETREYRRDVRDARRDYRQDVRRGENPYNARREYREDVRDARQDYFHDVRRDRNGWYYYQNNRRYYRPFASWTFSSGRFYRRY